MIPTTHVRHAIVPYTRRDKKKYIKKTIFLSYSTKLVPPYIEEIVNWCLILIKVSHPTTSSFLTLRKMKLAFSSPVIALGKLLFPSRFYHPNKHFDRYDYLYNLIQ